MSTGRAFRRCAILVIAFLTIGFDAAARAATISVNFVGGQIASGFGGPGAGTVSGTAGAVPAGNWNNATSNTASGLSLNDSTGSAAASISYTVNNTWAATNTTPGTDDGRLMNGYLDTISSPITVTGLGSAFTSQGYSVIVYQNADSAGSWGYTVADNAGHTGTRYGQQTGAGGTNYPLAGGTNGYLESTSTNPAGPGTSANFIRISGLTGTNFTITGNNGTTGDGRVRPNGFQIVSAPEPSSLAVVALGSLGLLVRRRRADPC